MSSYRDTVKGPSTPKKDSEAPQSVPYEKLGPIAGNFSIPSPALDLQVEGAFKNSYHARARASPQIKQRMYRKTNRMIVFASPEYERAKFVPTTRKARKLLKRRYSIDITTKAWGHWSDVGCSVEDKSPRAPDGTPLVLSDVRRYSELDFVLAQQPLLNQEIYLELGAATIRNDAFHCIGATDKNRDGYEVWMRGESLDMAFEVLRAEKRWEDSSIDFANCGTAQIFYFAFVANDANERCYDEYRARFQNKKWIFIICNDGVGGQSNEGSSGTHWSLLAVDRIHRTVHYYDSLLMSMASQHSLGLAISKGLLNILGENLNFWQYFPENNSPDQKEHNQFQSDDGPCGPFVWKLTEFLSDHIQLYIRARRENECSLRLSPRFPTNFKTMFHSFSVRRNIQCAMARWKCITDQVRVSEEHAQAAVQEEGVELLQEPNVRDGSAMAIPQVQLEDESDPEATDVDSDDDTDDDDDDDTDDDGDNDKNNDEGTTAGGVDTTAADADEV